MGTATALHLAAHTDFCQSAIFLNGVGLTPHRSVYAVFFCAQILFTLKLKILICTTFSKMDFFWHVVLLQKTEV